MAEQSVQRIWSCTFLSIAIALSIDLQCGAGEAREGRNTEIELDKLIDAWHEHMSGNLYLSDYSDNEYYRAIIDLGVPAVPHLMARIEKGNWALSDAVEMITGKRFEDYEWPQGTPGGSQASARLLLKWWPKARKETPQRFAGLYTKWETLKAQGEPEKAREQLRRIRNLGIGALPMMVDKVEQGDQEMAILISQLTHAQVAPNATKVEIASWWQKNRDKWLISFPNGRPIAKVGPDESVTAGDTVQLDASASDDPDGDPLAFQWTQIGGPAVTLSDGTARNPTFVAPRVRRETLLIFQLVADDAGDLSKTVPTPNSRSEPATVKITVQENYIIY